MHVHLSSCCFSETIIAFSGTHNHDHVQVHQPQATHHAGNQTSSTSSRHFSRDSRLDSGTSFSNRIPRNSSAQMHALRVGYHLPRMALRKAKGVALWAAAARSPKAQVSRNLRSSWGGWYWGQPLSRAARSRKPSCALGASADPEFFRMAAAPSPIASADAARPAPMTQLMSSVIR